jgi:hypothetical protein
VDIVNNNVEVKIPFDLHGPDCGAPDCYSTELSFSFRIIDTLIFPAKLPFREHEHGCIEKESRISGAFELVEQTKNYVIYHSAKHRRTLVLFATLAESGSIAYYFTNVSSKRIRGENLYRILDDYNADDKKSVYPFMSWALSTKEYESFQ